MLIFQMAYPEDSGVKWQDTHQVTATAQPVDGHTGSLHKSLLF